MSIKGKIIRVTGIVQGVGFRPFIARLARSLNLSGYVKNIGGSEVEIYIEGKDSIVEGFIEKMLRNKPDVAEIDEIFIEDTSVLGFNNFQILPSSTEVKEPSMIPPDFGICPNCLEEVLNPQTRWYLYPFNSCAWCGPRYSIMYKVPYDRENTSMRDFPLCNDCRSEYGDIKNIRRYHVQGISCPKCGPRIWLTDKDGNILIKESEKCLKEVSSLIGEGNIVAIKGLGGFHIAALATDDEVILRLRKRKKRPEKPFALMALDLSTINKFAEINLLTESLLTSPQKPIVLLPMKRNSEISKYVAPKLNLVGVMLPYTALHYLILSETRDKVLIMTSGNPPGKPMCTTNKCALSKLSGIVDYFLLHNRKIVNRVDDSVVRETAGEVTFLRRARGYAPKWLKVPWKIDKNVLAFGADLQTAGAVYFDDKIILTQYIGDIDEFENLDFLSRALKYFIETYKLDLKKSLIVSDLHPYYQSTLMAEKWAKELGRDLNKVQHHHAHIASVMVEKGFSDSEEVVGIAIDGVGLGIDGAIWGGEILVVSYKEFKRVGHLEYQPMPSGDKATIYPIRMLIGILSKKFGWDEIEKILKKFNLVSKLKYGLKEAEVAYKLAVNPNTIKTSSIGRVLDAVSALLGVCYLRTYEGEPAMKLEAFASNNGGHVSDIDIGIEKSDGIWIIKTGDLFTHIIDLIESGKDKRDIALSVHFALGKSLAEVAVREASIRGINKIVVSGGAAVNSHIIRAVKEVVNSEGFEIYLPNRVPAGDGGIAVGQAIIASYRNLEKETG